MGMNSYRNNEDDRLSLNVERKNYPFRILYPKETFFKN